MIVASESLPERVLFLDTAPWLLIATGEIAAMAPALPATLETAAKRGKLAVSVASVWELTQLVDAGHLQVLDLDEWVRNQCVAPGVRLYYITDTIALAARYVDPRIPMRDPMLRFIIATVRAYNGVFITTDPMLLDAAAAGEYDAYDARTHSRPLEASLG